MPLLTYHPLAPIAGSCGVRCRPQAFGAVRARQGATGARPCAALAADGPRVALLDVRVRGAVVRGARAAGVARADRRDGLWNRILGVPVAPAWRQGQMLRRTPPCANLLTISLQSHYNLLTISSFQPQRLHHTSASANNPTQTFPHTHRALPSSVASHGRLRLGFRSPQPSPHLPPALAFLSSGDRLRCHTSGRCSRLE